MYERTQAMNIRYTIYFFFSWKDVICIFFFFRISKKEKYTFKLKKNLNVNISYVIDLLINRD